MQQAPQTGDMLGRYRLGKLIGSGGFGSVFAVEDAQRGRQVALKVVRPVAGARADNRDARFAREVAVLQQLSNPHTVRLLEFGRSDEGLLYMVFEYVDGLDVDELVAREGAQTASFVRAMLVQILGALCEAHDGGVLHRDVKPGNIRVRSVDPPDMLLLDFGIAKPLDDVAPITHTGDVVGTLLYASPEQLTGGVLSPASDLFGLGAVAYFAIRGSIPRPLWLRTPETPLDMPDLADSELAAVIDRLLQRDPESRFRTAREALAALGARQPENSPERPAAAAPTAAGSSIKLRTSIAVLLLVAIVLAVLALILSSEPVAPPPAVRTLPTELSAMRPPPTRDVATESDAGIEADAEARCAADAPFRGLGALEQVVGLDRVSWPAYVPEAYDPAKPTPLLLLVHQFGDNARGFLSYSGAGELAEKANVIVVAPENSRMDPWLRPDDIEILREAHRLATEAFCIDESRVFAIGNGYGGAVVERLPCEMPAITAIATTNFRSNSKAVRCEPRRPVPYIHLASLDDGYNPVKGGEGCSGVNVISLAEKERLWRGRQQCDGPPRKRAVGEASCYRWTCEAPLEICHMPGGHNWPGLRRRNWDYRKCDGTPPNFDFMGEIWGFFDRVGARSRVAE